MENSHAFTELVRAGALLSNEQRFTRKLRILVDQAYDITQSASVGLYLYEKSEMKNELILASQRGGYPLPDNLDVEDELVKFMEECGEALVLNDPHPLFFRTAFLSSDMRSSLVLPLFTENAQLGYLILNSRDQDFFRGHRFLFIDSLVRLASGILHSANLYSELQRQFKQVEELRRYQENIFSSMTDLLIATDARGNIHYFNQAARDRLELDDSFLGASLEQSFSRYLGRKVLKAIRNSDQDGKLRPGLKGIIKKDDGDMDFSLTISPLLGKRGGREGLTLLFTDQTRERELQAQMVEVVEDRRAIKDMFARYLSNDIVKTLVESPELVKPGGDKKTATIFFADIRGYTAFSETKEPEFIIDVLNEYFSQAVEVIIKYKGYIDKFIGDCIMAAWGVPIYSKQEDALAAVGCAVEIQEMVQSAKRSFFTGQASHLKVGIGMHTGPLIAGNLGSARRMDYSVIGDTVNVAARLEGVAGAGEVIITENTRDLIGDSFKLKELKPVSVKGKSKPLHIFKVINRIR